MGEWWGVVLLFAATVVSEAATVRLSRASGEGGSACRSVSVSTMPHLASALLLPPPMAAGIAGVAMLVDQLRCRAPLRRLLFNVALTALRALSRWCGE